MKMPDASPEIERIPGQMTVDRLMGRLRARPNARVIALNDGIRRPPAAGGQPGASPQGQCFLFEEVPLLRAGNIDWMLAVGTSIGERASDQQLQVQVLMCPLQVELGVPQDALSTHAGEWMEPLLMVTYGGRLGVGVEQHPLGERLQRLLIKISPELNWTPTSGNVRHPRSSLVDSLEQALLRLMDEGA